jgi:membrane-associated phospholipid phosphatase
VAAVFAGVIPYGIILLGVRRGSLGDHHVTTREQRLRPLLAGLVSVAAGVVLLVVLGAPRQVVALIVAMLAGLAVTALITHWWKISAHAAVAAGTATILMAAFGPALAVAWPVVAAVGWSRVVLREHTLAQVLGGVPMGALVAGGVFVALR